MLFLHLALILYQGQTVSTESVFAQAARAIAAGDYKAAEAGFKEVLRREPSNLGALGNLGVIYSRQNAPAKAVETYQRALRLAPNEPGLMLNLGLAYLKLDNYASAKLLFAKLAEQPSPRQLQARELHAISQLQTGEIETAATTLEALLNQPQPSPGVYHFLALAYVKLKQPAKAQQVFDQLLSKLPAAQAHYLEGRVWYDAAIFDRALANFEKASKSDASLKGLSLELGKTLVSLRNYPEAEVHLRKALDLTPDDVEAKYFLGALLVQQTQHAEGVALLSQVQLARPDLWGTAYYLGKAQLALGKPAIALTLLKEAASRAPNEAPVQYQLARALQSLGRKTEAAQAFARVSKLQLANNSESIVMK